MLPKKTVLNDFTKDTTKLTADDFKEGVCIKDNTNWTLVELKRGICTDIVRYYAMEPELTLPKFKEDQFYEKLKNREGLTPYQILKSKEFSNALHFSNILQFEVPNSFTENYSAHMRCGLGTTLNALLEYDTLFYFKKIPLSYVKSVQWIGLKEHAQELLQNDETLSKQLKGVIAFKEALARLDTKSKSKLENQDKIEEKTQNGGKAL